MASIEERKKEIDKLTLADINVLHIGISKLKTIGEWKKIVKEFATKHGISDMAAIDVANHRY